jgi:hypothetical protein
VDYAVLREALELFSERTERGEWTGLVRELVQNAENGYIKLYVTKLRFELPFWASRNFP